MNDQTSPIRILVVDDHPVVRAGMQKGPAADPGRMSRSSMLSNMPPPEVWATKEKQWRDHTHHTARQDAEMGISI